MANRRLSRRAFARWLETKHPRTKVGLACQTDFCPLAKFLTQTTGESHCVLGDSYEAQSAEAATDLPVWAQHFIEEVDSRPSSTSLSASTALRIINRSWIGRDDRFYADHRS